MPDSASPSSDLDPELLARAQAGDETAFGVVMKSNYERTFRLVYSITRNEADARDLSQEIWLKVWRELPKFRGDSKFTTWLHAIATRRTLDHLRKKRRWFDRFRSFDAESDDLDATPEATSGGEDGRDHAEASDRATRLKNAMDTLPPKMRAVLALRELEGLSYEEIAEATSIPAGTVMSRIYHARRLLAQKLGVKS